ncbi:MAG: TlpA disulfide reductase family protein [Burkholderiaceae bacterium]
MRKLFLFSFWVFLAQSCIAASLEVGKTAPPLEVTQLDGTKFSLADHAGNVVLVNIWASWCEPCREEMPAIEAFYKAHHAEGLDLLAISLDDAKDLPQVKEVMRSYSYPAAMLADAKMKGYGRIWRMPMTFVIDRQGILRKDGSEGEPKMDLPALERVVTPLLKAK